MKKNDIDQLRPGIAVKTWDRVWGKYLEAYREGTNLVLLNPDVAKVFPTEEAVNKALRSLIEVAQRSVTPTKPVRRQREGSKP